MTSWSLLPNVRVGNSTEDFKGAESVIHLNPAIVPSTGPSTGAFVYSNDGMVMAWCSGNKEALRMSFPINASTDLVPGSYLRYDPNVTGKWTVETETVALGGYSATGGNANVNIGYAAGTNYPYAHTVPIQYQTSIGYYAGEDQSGNRAVNIGAFSNGTGNSICINASTGLFTAATEGFYVKPIRELATGANKALTLTAANEIVLVDNTMGKGEFASTTEQVITTGTSTSVKFTYTPYSTFGSKLTKDSSNDFFTNTSGKTLYLHASYQVTFSNSESGKRLVAGLSVDDNVQVMYGKQSILAVGGASMTLSGSALIKLDPASTLAVKVYHNNTGTTAVSTLEGQMSILTLAEIF